MVERRREGLMGEGEEGVDLKIVDVLMVRELSEFLEV
jgi:hypothetical protein